MTFNFIEGYMNELYNSMIVILNAKENWITWSMLYEKLNENIHEPLDFMDFLIGLIKDLATHHVGK
uniref:Bet v I/Major latex protein domain-containing protein n=1 Tax=Solanum lycopersicum TaxID=4081 RepID=A0A3Q7IG93_SOLLC